MHRDPYAHFGNSVEKLVQLSAALIMQHMCTCMNIHSDAKMFNYDNTCMKDDHENRENNSPMKILAIYSKKTRYGQQCHHHPIAGYGIFKVQAILCFAHHSVP